MRQMSIQEARERFAEAVSTAQFGRESIEITRYGKPVARLVPIENEGREIRIDDVFPELSGLDGEAAHEVILADRTELGEMVLYDYDGVTIQYDYAQARGRWIFTVSRKTDAIDAIGCAVWEHDYTVCASRTEAMGRYHAAIGGATKHWREGSPPMWFDMIGSTFANLGEMGAIPLGSFGAEEEASPEHTSLHDEIVSAYNELVAAAGGWVMLTRLRAHLATYTRAEVDAALSQLYATDRIRLIAEVNQAAMTDADRDAALSVGGDHKHLYAVV